MKIAIIGGGFAGLQALKILKKIAHDHTIILFDKNPYTSFIPALPDLAGGKYQQQSVSEKIHRLISKKIQFIQDTINDIDFNKMEIIGDKTHETFDYLLLCAGSVINFFGFNQNLSSINVLDSIESALKLHKNFLEYIQKKITPNIIICGTGYTGLELAFTLKYLADKKNKPINIQMIDYKDNIMPFLSDKERNKILDLLKKKNIHLLLKSTVTQFDGKNITINNGEKKFTDCFLCWTTGTKTSIDNLTGQFNRLNDGRIKVNEYLQIPHHPHVFIAGDFAAIEYKGSYLRKALNFSIYSGEMAGKNILRLILNKKLKRFNPVDLGWVLPLHEMGIGKIFNKFNINGNLALRLHYFFCAYRNYNMANFLKFLFTVFFLKK